MKVVYKIAIPLWFRRCLGFISISSCSSLHFLLLVEVHGFIVQLIILTSWRNGIGHIYNNVRLYPAPTYLTFPHNKINIITISYYNQYIMKSNDIKQSYKILLLQGCFSFYYYLASNLGRWFHLFRSGEGRFNN
jgi:hypothetical protein